MRTSQFEFIKAEKVRWVGYAAGMGEMENAYRILVGKT
jgi:hypothetical protein